MLEVWWFWRAAVINRHLFLLVKNPMAVYLVLPQRTFTPLLSPCKSPADWPRQPSGTVTSLGARGSVTLGTTLRQGAKSLRGSGPRQGDLTVPYHIFLMLCINAYLCSGDSSESRVWGWKGLSHVCCLVDFQLNLHQLAKPWDYGNLVHWDNGSSLRRVSLHFIKSYKISLAVGTQLNCCCW